ncbi:MAG: hypothetical protein WC959_07060 [Kiritimatiellales bacterium]
MKNNIKLILSAGTFFCIAGIAAAQPTVIYAQGFSNHSGEPKDVSAYGWQTFTRDTAVDSTVSRRIVSTAGSDLLTNVNAPTPYGDRITAGLYNANSQRITLSFTPLLLDPRNYSEITFSFDLKNSAAPSKARFAFQAGRNWYVSERSFNQITELFVNYSVTLQNEKFLRLNFVPKKTLSIDSRRAIQFAKISGDIINAGFFLEPNTGDDPTAMRIDNFVVTAVKNANAADVSASDNSAAAKKVLVYGTALQQSPEFMNALKAADFEVEPADAGKISAVSPESARTIVFADVCPPESRPALARFLRGGGNIFVIGPDVFDYRPVPANSVQLWSFASNAEIIYPRRTEPGVPVGSLEAATITKVVGPDGAPALNVKTLEKGMDSTMVSFPAKVSALNPARNVLVIRAKGSTYAELLLLEICDRGGSRWISFLPVTSEWDSYAVTLADFMPEKWADAHKPYPLLNPEQIKTIGIGIHNSVTWREKPMEFSVGTIDLAENSAGVYTPTALLPKMRIPFLELGITAPRWIFDPFAGAAPLKNAGKIIPVPGAGKFAAGEIAGISSAWICPPPYMEHPGTQMGTDHKKDYDTKAEHAMRRISLYYTGALDSDVAELRFFAGGEHTGASLSLFGFEPVEFVKNPALVSSLISGINYALFSTKILSVSPNTTRPEYNKQAKPLIKVTLYNPTDQIVRGTLKVSAGAGMLHGETALDVPRRNIAVKTVELTDVPENFPFKSFDWQAVYEWDGGADQLTDHVDAERILLHAARHMVRIQKSHDDGRLTNHFFGDAYGVRAMYLYLNWLKKNPEQLKDNADLWEDMSPEAIEKTARRFTEMILTRQNPDGAIPMGYGEHQGVYNNADGGNICVALMQAAARMDDAELRERIYSCGRRFLDVAETFYIDEKLSRQLTKDQPKDAERNWTKAGHYGLGFGSDGKLTKAGPWYVVPDVMGAQAIIAVEKNDEHYRKILRRNTDAFLDAGYSAAGYFQAEALVWSYLTFDDTKLHKAIENRLRDTFINGLLEGRENHFCDLGGRGSLRALSLLFYQQLVENSTGSRAALLKYLWGTGSESSNVSVRRQAEIHPRPRHGESIAAGKLAEYTSIWMIEMLDPGCTVLPCFEHVMQSAK